MLQKEYIESMQKRFMVLESRNSDSSDLQEKMLTYNEPEGLLKLELHKTNNITYYHYDVGGLQTLEEVFERVSPDSQILRRIISSIISIILKGKEFFLNEDDFVISPGFIFCKEGMDVEIKLCYYPGYAKPLREQIYSFFEILMNTIDYKDDKAVVYVYGMYRKARETGCTFDDLLQDFVSPAMTNNAKETAADNAYKMESLHRNSKRLENPEININSITPIIRGKNYNRINKVNITKQKSVINLKDRVNNEKKDNYADKSIYNYLPAVISIILMLTATLYAISQNMFISPGGDIEIKKLVLVIIFMAALGLIVYKNITNNRHEKTTEFHEKEYQEKADIFHRTADSCRLNSIPDTQEERPTVYLDTVLLPEKHMDCYYLEPVDERDGVCLYPDKYPFVIGSRREYSDGIIHADTVSRKHAQLEITEGGLFIRDLESKNGTYVNEDRLCPGECVRIMPDDTVMFAKKKYVIRRKGI